MGKEITENFSIKCGYKNESLLTVTARNYNRHQICINANPISITTDEMRLIAAHIIESADKIDNDKDFNQK